MDPSGNVVCTGISDGRFAVGHFTPAGAADTNFNGGAPVLFGGASQPARILGDVVTAADGSITAVGASGNSVIVTRVTPAGALDTTFDPAGATPGIEIVPGLVAQDLTGIPDFTEGLAVQSDGKLLVANRTAAGDFGVVRLNTDGSVDPAFGNAGLATIDLGGDDDADAVSVASDGGILVAGTTTRTTTTTLGGGSTVSLTTTATAIAALNADGSLNPSFGTNGTEVFDSGLSASVARPADARGAAAGASPARRTPRASAPSSSRSSDRSNPTAACWWGPASRAAPPATRPCAGCWLPARRPRPRRPRPPPRRRCRPGRWARRSPTRSALRW